MGIYGRKMFDAHNQAIDAASSMISIAIVGNEYAGRLDAYMDDFTDISEMFWARCPLTRKKLELPGRDVRDVARIFHHLVLGCKISGLESFRFERTLERCRRKVKGKLFQTRMLLSENDKKSKCLSPDEHLMPCQCKPLRLMELAQMEQQ